MATCPSTLRRKLSNAGSSQWQPQHERKCPQSLFTRLNFGIRLRHPQSGFLRKMMVAVRSLLKIGWWNLRIDDNLRSNAQIQDWAFAPSSSLFKASPTFIGGLVNLWQTGPSHQSSHSLERTNSKMRREVITATKMHVLVLQKCESSNR